MKNMRLLYAIDLRDTAGWMLAPAAAFAARLAASLDLVYVDPFGNTRSYVVDPQIHDLLTRELEALRKRRVAQLEQLAMDLPEGVRGEVFVRDGDAVDEIVHLAEGYDAVLVGTHGRHGLNRMLLGSVAERIVRRSPVTAIVLRAAHPADSLVLAPGGAAN